MESALIQVGQVKWADYVRLAGPCPWTLYRTCHKSRWIFFKKENDLSWSIRVAGTITGQTGRNMFDSCEQWAMKVYRRLDEGSKENARRTQRPTDPAPVVRWRSVALRLPNASLRFAHRPGEFQLFIFWKFSVFGSPPPLNEAAN